jgi:thiol-disulfide isomerase/thioredoxin
MRCIFSYILIIFSLAGITAQTISIKVNNLNISKVELSYLRSGNYIFIDSLYSIEKDNFQYTFAKNASHPGFYRINITTKKWVDFIIDNEDVILTIDLNNITDSMKVISSESNKLYYDFINLNRHSKIIIEGLQAILAEYSKQYLEFVNITSQKNSHSFAARYIKTVQLPVEDISLSNEKRVAYEKVHFFDNIDFNDDDLLYSDAFDNLCQKYVTLFKNSDVSKELLTKDLKSSVDTILNKAKINLLVYQDITTILIDKFRETGFSSIVNYIVDNYVIKDDLCLDENFPVSIQQRIDQSKSFRIGTKVPNLILPDSLGKKVDLKNIKSDKTLILFYASWCPHCKKLLPELNKIYLNQKEKRLKILAVSLDTNRSDWVNFIRANNYDWINVSDLRGGHGRAVKDFKIYATPAMFLVNDNKELIAIPADAEDLKKYFY